MNFIYQWQDVIISFERMDEIHDKYDEENKDKHIVSLLENTKNDIIIKDLVLQYEGSFSKKVLNNSNLVISEGKVTAIVGASVMGKTNLVKLLLGNYSLIEDQFIWEINLWTNLI